MAGTEKPKRVQAIQRSVQILDELSETGETRVTELSESTGMAKSTIHRYLDTLQDLHYVVRNGEKYCLSLRFLNIGQSARNRRPEYTLAKTKVDQLAEETDERCQFVVEEHGRGVYAYVAAGSDAVLTDSRVGKRLHMHATSVGKSMLAHMPDSRVHEILDQWGLPQLTQHTVTDREELFAELDTIREEGVAFNREGNVEGLRSVGAPVLDGNGETVGAISISGPTHRMRGSRYGEEIPDLLLGATNELRLRLEYDEERV